MQPRIDSIPGMRAPTDTERLFISEAWRSGTGPNVLRGYQIFLSAVVVLLTVVVFNGNSNGMSAGFILFVVFVAVMVMFILNWGKFIRRINERQRQLDAGNFTIVSAEGERPATLSSYNFYIGFGDARLGNGVVLKGLQMPYKPAVRMRRKRVKNFSAYVVQIIGEDRPMIFLREN